MTDERFADLTLMALTTPEPQISSDPISQKLDEAGVLVNNIPGVYYRGVYQGLALARAIMRGEKIAYSGMFKVEMDKALSSGKDSSNE